MPTARDGRPSTDGTWLGAEIAALYGTDDDNEIIRIQERQRIEETRAHLTGMDEEQRDWEEGLDD
jgi:hypothetical protein